MKLLILFIIWLPISSILLMLTFIKILKNQNDNLSDAYVLGSKTEELSEIPFVFTQASAVPKKIEPDTDIRIIVLRKFLYDYKSPLIYEVGELIKQADLWGLDYALIPAIAMQESGGCKVIPVDSYNCWGFGIYGDKSLKFKNFKAAISAVAKTIKETYIKNGLTNATLLEDRWAPPSRGQWSYSVNFFIGKIREYERNLTAS